MRKTCTKTLVANKKKCKSKEEEEEEKEDLCFVVQRAQRESTHIRGRCFNSSICTLNTRLASGEKFIVFLRMLVCLNGRSEEKTL